MEHTKDKVDIKTLKKAKYNPRKISKREMDSLVRSIKKYGLVQPILVNKDMTIIGGHQRVDACRKLGYKEVDILIVDLPDEDEKELNIALNKISGDWDERVLTELLNELAEKSKLIYTGFNEKELEKLRWKQGNKINRKLIEDYIVPPFSIFDTKQGYWQKRKKEWLQQIGDSGKGRDGVLISKGLGKLGKLKDSSLTGTSIFDPVLCEVLYTWYADQGGLIIDPFAGGNTRGLIASILGYRYIGTDVSKQQVLVNKGKAKEIGETNATWHTEDGANLNKHVKKGEADLVFTCPPYYDLEVYDKNNPSDISNAGSYEEFLKGYTNIMHNTYDLLGKGKWAIIVVGNVRDKDGNYYDLVGDTVRLMEEAGFSYYNEIILATAIATATVRARKTFDGGKKVVKTHQNILFFAKGKEVAINKTLKALLQEGRTATAHHDVLVFKK